MDQVYSKRLTVKLKIIRKKASYIVFKKVLVDLRSFMRGKSYDNNDDLTQLRVLDDIL